MKPENSEHDHDSYHPNKATFNELGKYLAKLKSTIQSACQNFGPIHTPKEVEIDGISIQILNVTGVGDTFNRFVVGNVEISINTTIK